MITVKLISITVKLFILLLLQEEQISNSVCLKLTCKQKGVPFSRGTPFFYQLLLKCFTYMDEFSIT